MVVTTIYQAELGEAIASARKLRVLQVDADWLTAAVMAPAKRAKFDIDDAREMMLKDGSQLRNICVCGVSFRVGIFYAIASHMSHMIVDRVNGFLYSKQTGQQQ
jgi:hypothetical protein